MPFDNKTENEDTTSLINTELKPFDTVVQDTENILPPEVQRTLIREKKIFYTSRSNKLPEFTVNKIILALENEYNSKNSGIFQTKLTDDQVKIILSVHFQQGATSRSCDGNTSVNIFDRDFNLSTIRKILKSTGNKNSERKLARAMATYIHSVCSILEISGNLCNKISRSNMGKVFTVYEEAWLSDFQADNKDCPAYLRDFINKSFIKTPVKGNKQQMKTMGN